MSDLGGTPIPTETGARFLIMGKTAAKMAFNEIKYRAKRPFLGEVTRENQRSLNDTENAKLLFAALSQLRGTATKLAQAFAMELDILPSYYSEELAKSFYKVPPLNRTLMRKVIINEFGAPPEEIFYSFSSYAFACASIGQVHRAITHDKFETAVKIQYPGIEQATINDLKLVKNIAARIPKYKFLFQAAKELERGILEEIDYKIEAQNTQFFYENCHLPNIIVPRVLPQFCTKKVIVTEYIYGLHLDDFLKRNPTQNERDQFAQTLYDFFIFSLRKLNRLHADPNPGNFLFRENGTLAIIDFGCVKKIRPEFARLIPKIFQSHLVQNKQEIIALYKQLGIKAEDLTDELYEEFLKPFGQWSVAPLKQESFDFGQTKQSELGKEYMRKISKLEVFANVIEDFIFFNRTIYGLCKVFEQLEAKIQIKSRWQVE